MQEKEEADPLKKAKTRLSLSPCAGIATARWKAATRGTNQRQSSAADWLSHGIR